MAGIWEDDARRIEFLTLLAMFLRESLGRGYTSKALLKVGHPSIYIGTNPY